ASPASRKVYVSGDRHPFLRIPLREIDLHPSSGEPPARVYDSSGPYTDPNAGISIQGGLAPLRDQWVRARGDVEEYAGRPVGPEEKDAVGDNARAPEFPAKRRPLRARGGAAVTQLDYARRGIVTPEMEFVAIRENEGRARRDEALARDGEDFGASLPDYVT